MWNIFCVNSLKRKGVIAQNNGFKFDSEITWRHPLHHLSREFPSIVTTGFTLNIQADNQDYSGKGDFFWPETFELIRLPELVVYMFEVFKAG